MIRFIPSFHTTFCIIAWILPAPGFAADAALIEAAKKEGSLTWYTSQIIDQLGRPMAEAFQKKYGIKVNYVRADSFMVAQRLSAEAKAGKVVADVFDGNSITLTMKKQNIIMKWQPDHVARLPKQFVDPEGYWTAASSSVITLGYNSNLVPPGTQPKSYQELLDPKWSGKLVWSSLPNPSGAAGFVGSILTAMGQEKGMDYLQKLNKQKIVSLPQSARQVLDQVIAGEYPVAMQIFRNHAVISASSGAPSAWSPLDATMAYSLVYSVTREAPNPNAGKLFVDFVTSRDGQIIIRDADYMPIDPDVPPRDPAMILDDKRFRVAYFSPEQLEEEIPKWRNIYKQIFE